MRAAIAVAAASLLAVGGLIAVAVIERSQKLEPASPVSVPSSGDVRKAWVDYQKSSASSMQKALYTAELYCELPLITQHSRKLVLPDFLMKPGTSSQAYADGRLTAFYTAWKAWGDAWIRDFKYLPSIQGCRVRGSKATVLIFPNAAMHMESVSGTAYYPGVTHRLELEKNAQGEWIVTRDEYSDEFTEAYGPNVDWKSLIQSLPGEIAKEKAEGKAQASGHPKNSNSSDNGASNAARSMTGT